MGEYVYIWEFRVAPAQRDAFVEAYGNGGAWEKLFRRADGYVGTTLLRSRSDADVFVTIDRWSTLEAFLAFKKDFAADYAAVDHACERFTVNEREIGTYDSF